MISLGYAWLPNKYFIEDQAKLRKTVEVDLARTPGEKRSTDLHKRWLEDERIPSLEFVLSPYVLGPLHGF